uniref:WRKY domain-containing protein n=1 Tax=Quercus lobata TaxID=97700 RepID=A0A7N2MN53_QUELO
MIALKNLDNRYTFKHMVVCMPQLRFSRIAYLDLLLANIGEIIRGYYRCTHRRVQGCLATKQVQRSDEDPTVFKITYRGRHTCALALSASKTKPVHRSAL